KLLGLGYPGGPIVDKLSTHGDPRAVKFPPAQLKHRDRNDRGAARTYDGPCFDFSYSGIKTAVLRYVETHNMQSAIAERRQRLSATAQPEIEDYLSCCDQPTLNLVASFQRAMVEDLAEKTLAAARAYDVETLFVTGGVAANQELHRQFEKDTARE